MVARGSVVLGAIAAYTAPMRVVMVGSGGQLGRELRKVLPRETTVALERSDLDVCDGDAVATRLAALGPEVIINAAADNRVDAAETAPADAVGVNVLGAASLARASRDLDALLVQVSTDYVFDGCAKRPYSEEDVPNPLGAYGRSKLAGELMVRTIAPRHAVVRTAGLYAAGGTRAKGGSFIDRVLEKARAGEPLSVVADQVTAPTWARDLAVALARLLPRLASGEAPAGIYHITNAGECSWYEFAARVLELTGLPAAIEPVETQHRPALALRPAYSVLANTRLAALGEPPLRSWQDALAAYVKNP
jgi:dTDP-4-dehydrorhamnose reductase